jgi:hypothetical protein
MGHECKGETPIALVIRWRSTITSLLALTKSPVSAT